MSNHQLFLRFRCFRSPEYTEGVGVPPLVHGSGWAFALRAALSLFLSSHSDVSNLCIPCPGNLINGEKANRPCHAANLVSRAPRSRVSRKLPSIIPEFASPSMGPIRYLILLHRQHTSVLVAKVACRSLVCLARMVTQTRGHSRQSTQ